MSICVNFHPITDVPDECLKYAVIMAEEDGRWLICRHKERTTWEIPGGHREADERIEETARRELYEETGIQAGEEEFEYIGSDRDGNTFYDFYCLKNATPIEDIVLLEGETTAAKWVTFAEIREMIKRREICRIIGRQFLNQEPQLLERQEPGYR